MRTSNPMSPTRISLLRHIHLSPKRLQASWRLSSRSFVVFPPYTHTSGSGTDVLELIDSCLEMTDCFFGTNLEADDTSISDCLSLSLSISASKITHFSRSLEAAHTTGQDGQAYSPDSRGDSTLASVNPSVIARTIANVYTVSRLSHHPSQVYTSCPQRSSRGNLQCPRHSSQSQVSAIPLADRFAPTC